MGNTTSVRNGAVPSDSDEQNVVVPSNDVVSEDFGVLPEGVVASVLSLTTPKEACRLALVATVFWSASGWDKVWESFLPKDYKELIDQATNVDAAALRFDTKKELFMYLADHPLIIDGGRKSFSIDKCSGKKCYMLAARDITIVWGDTPRYWKWISLPESRFSEVAELIEVCWLEIHGKINTRMLSPNTTYAAYLVFKKTVRVYGLGYHACDVSVRIAGDESRTQTVYLEANHKERARNAARSRRNSILNRVLGERGAREPEQPDVKYPEARVDGWMEVPLGEFVNKDGDDGELEMRLEEVKGGNWKGGIIVQGIEIRPKGGFNATRWEWDAENQFEPAVNISEADEELPDPSTELFSGPDSDYEVKSMGEASISSSTRYF